MASLTTFECPNSSENRWKSREARVHPQPGVQGSLYLIYLHITVLPVAIASYTEIQDFHRVDQARIQFSATKLSMPFLVQIWSSGRLASDRPDVPSLSAALTTAVVGGTVLQLSSWWKKRAFISISCCKLHVWFRSTLTVHPLRCNKA
jgi:hypothetical protein